MSRTLASILRPLLRQTSIMKLRKSRSRLPVTASKFGGVPYLEQGEVWPTCPICHQSLSFICQIDLRDTVFKELVGFDLFSFFYCWNCFPQDDSPSNAGAWLVKTYIAPQKGKSLPVQLPSGVNQTAECRVSFQEAQAVPDWEGTTRWCPKACDVAKRINADEPWTAYQDAVTAIIGHSPEIQSCIGGDPRWIQGEETPDNMTFLAQIDSEEDKADIMWGDVGSIYLFVSTKPAQKFRMVFQCC
jgi:uncharacterized protein YwqG